MKVLWRLPRESKEFVGPIGVFSDGQAADDFEVQIVRTGERPTEEAWEPPLTLNGEKGILIGPGSSHEMSRGFYFIWGRAQSTLETPVIEAIGVLRIT